MYLADKQTIPAGQTLTVRSANRKLTERGRQNGAIGNPVYPAMPASSDFGVLRGDIVYEDLTARGFGSSGTFSEACSVLNGLTGTGREDLREDLWSKLRVIGVAATDVPYVEDGQDGVFTAQVGGRCTMPNSGPFRIAAGEVIFARLPDPDRQTPQRQTGCPFPVSDQTRKLETVPMSKMNLGPTAMDFRHLMKTEAFAGFFVEMARLLLGEVPGTENPDAFVAARLQAYDTRAPGVEEGRTRMKNVLLSLNSAMDMAANRDKSAALVNELRTGVTPLSAAVMANVQGGCLGVSLTSAAPNQPMEMQLSPAPVTHMIRGLAPRY